MIKKPEVISIVCAAIYYEDGLVYKEQPINIKTGIVVTGRRHNNAYMTLEQLMADRFDTKYLPKDCMGFITSIDTYVGRHEAYHIAKRANQLLHDLHDQTNLILVSEDLYDDLPVDNLDDVDAVIHKLHNGVTFEDIRKSYIR